MGNKKKLHEFLPCVNKFSLQGLEPALNLAFESESEQPTYFILNKNLKIFTSRNGSIQMIKREHNTLTIKF